MRASTTRWRRLRDTFWVLPALVIAVAIACGVALPAIDRSIALPGWVPVSAQQDTTRSVLTAIVALGVSVAGVSFSVIVVALVLATQQLSPRVLRTFQHQRLNQVVLALLLGSSTFALFVLGSVGDATGDPVPELSVLVAMGLASVSLGVFVVFLHHAIRSLNASAVIRRIAAEGHEAIRRPYPDGAGSEPEDVASAERHVSDLERSPAAEVHAPRAGYVAAVDGAKLVEWAAAEDLFVDQRRGVGDFVVTGTVLALVRGPRARGVESEDVGRAFTLDEERVVEGDIAFPIRQLADIALKGLSPGVNDPTTAENAMDSVADTLVRFAQRPAVAALRVDDRGVPRLRAIAPSLDALVRLGFDQVRRDAADRPSFAVRLLELLADIQRYGGIAGRSEEIDRQAELIASRAAALAGETADQQFVTEAFERLRGRPATVS